MFFNYKEKTKKELIELNKKYEILKEDYDEKMYSPIHNHSVEHDIWSLEYKKKRYEDIKELDSKIIALSPIVLIPICITLPITPIGLSLLFLAFVGATYGVTIGIIEKDYPKTLKKIKKKIPDFTYGMREELLEKYAKETRERSETLDDMGNILEQTREMITARRNKLKEIAEFENMNEYQKLNFIKNNQAIAYDTKEERNLYQPRILELEEKVKFIDEVFTPQRAHFNEYEIPHVEIPKEKVKKI